MKEKFLEELKKAVIEMKVEHGKEIAERALSEKIGPVELINKALIPGLQVVGEKFKRDEIFLPEVMLSAKVFQAVFQILKPYLKAGEFKPKGKIVLGTVRGDVHDIGKNIVAVLLEGNGYEVIDLGVNVAPDKFIEAITKYKPQVLGMSTLLTTTMPEMKTVIEMLKESGLRDKVKVIIGGAPVSAEFSKKISADGYGADAQEGVEIINKWIEKG